MSKIKTKLPDFYDGKTLGGVTHPCDVDYDYQISRAEEQKREKERNEVIVISSKKQ